MMRYVLYAIVILYIAISLCIFCYDLFVSLKEKYSCFHIGRWNNKQNWMEAVIKINKKWAVHTPILRLKNDCRYLLIDRIKGNYGKSMVQSWQKAGCILGLEEANVEDLDKILSKIKKQIFNDNGDWKASVNKIDYAMLAYSVLKNEKDVMSIKLAMDNMILCIESNICKDGLVSYSAGADAKRRYVDTIGFICPFLALYSKVYNEPKYLELAINQIRIFRENGMLKNLPVHCYIAESKLPVGIYGWGRGSGWYTLGLIDMFLEIDESNKHYAYLKSVIQEIADACVQFEREDRGFSSILPDGGRYDSSATAMLGYFYARCGTIFNNSEFTNISERCLKKLISVTKIYGVVNECQGDTIDIGIFSQRYQEMPFVQGMTLRLSSLLD